jgi:peptidoglycan/LPS O-acetylase OafA/YrhL
MTPRRFHSLDAARAGAMLLGIVVHSTISFWPGFREGRYAVSDDYPSATLSGLYFVLHIFRMSLFFAIAGFFAHVLVERLGAWGFVKNRLRRIALPFIVSLIVCIPVIVICFFWAHAQTGTKGVPIITPPIPNPQPPPWIHLWFLYLLLVFYALTVGWRLLLSTVDRHGRITLLAERALGVLVTTRLAPIALGLPAALVLYYTAWWIPWQGLPSPIMGFIPNFPGLLAYGAAFGFGWFLHRQTAWLDLLKRDWAGYLVVATVLTLVSLGVVGPRPQLYVPVMEPLDRIVFSLAYNIGGWCWVLGLIGAAVRFLDEPSARWRYLSDAAFTVYIVHLPVSYTLATWMMRWPLHWSVKFVLIAVFTTLITFSIYHWLVRSTFVGQFLNGTKKSGGWDTPPVSAPAKLSADA